MIVAGVDVGSTATKSILMNENGEIVARALTGTGANIVKAAERVFDQSLKKADVEEWDIVFTVGTGYGRFRIPFGDTHITEISCHAKGAHFLHPGTRTILDIGGQDTKAIKVGPKGEVIDFCMNDKCAAGTGRFLEAAANVMNITLDELGVISLKSEKPLRITNVCTVFVESEIISHLAWGKKPEDILMGVHNSISGRSSSLLRRVGLESELTFTGGVSKNIGMVTALKNKLKIQINATEDSQYTGAIGAALFALERASKKSVVVN